MIEPPLANIIPSQWWRHFEHVAACAAIGIAAWLGKRYLENNTLKKKIPNDEDRKVTSYVITILAGSAIGGTLKCLKTGTIEGTKVGIQAGFIVSLMGASLTDIDKFYKWLKGT